MRKQKQRKVRKAVVKKVPVNSRIPEDVQQRWHLFAAQNRLNKENALAELINRGAKA